MKRALLIFLLINVITFTASSQYMPARTISTPYGPARLPAMGSPTPMRFYSYNYGPYSVRYSFTIVLKNDSTINAKTKIELKEDKDQVTIKNGKSKTVFTPSDTKSIYRITATGEKLTGIPADTCWLFKSKAGKINAYSAIAEPGLSYISAIQLGDDGPILPINKENLLEMVQENEKAVQYVEKKKLTKAIEVFNEVKTSKKTSKK
jgi:hypothetical protein